MVRFTSRRRAGDSIVHPPNALDHSLGRSASAVDRDDGGKSWPPQSSNRIDAEGGVLPYTSTHTRLCKFHYDSGDATDEKRERVLEHPPRHGVGRHQRGLTRRLQEIGGRLVAEIKQCP